MLKDVPPGCDGYGDDMFESVHLMARLKPGVTIAETSAIANLLSQQILRGFSGRTAGPGESAKARFRA